jgi:hypothetical protein
MRLIDAMGIMEHKLQGVRFYNNLGNCWKKVVEDVKKMDIKNNIEVRIADAVYSPIDVRWTKEYGRFPRVELTVDMNDYCRSAFFKRHNLMYSPAIKKVHFNPPVTVVLWEDGTKTIVRAQNGEEYDPEKGLAMAFTKKVLGNKGSYFDEIKKWTEKE